MWRVRRPLPQLGHLLRGENHSHQRVRRPSDDFPGLLQPVLPSFRWRIPPRAHGAGLLRRLLVGGAAGRAGIQPRIERGALSFVVDSILLLRYVEVESAIQRAIAVMKMRGSDHVKEIRRYEIRRGGLVVTGPFEGRENILTGISHQVSR